MEDDLGAGADAVLVEGGPLDDLPLEVVVDLGQELEGQRLEDRRRRDAVRQQVVELRPHLQDPRGRVLVHDLLGDLADQRLPVRRRDRRFVGHFLAAKEHVLENERLLRAALHVLVQIRA